MSAAEVIDLCDSDDDDSVERIVRGAAKLAAAAPRGIIDLSRLNGKENNANQFDNTNDSNNDNRKPAAKVHGAMPGSPSAIRRRERKKRRTTPSLPVEWKDPSVTVVAVTTRPKDPPQPSAAVATREVARPKDPPNKAAAATTNAVEVTKIVRASSLTPLQQVLEIFPDVDIHHAQSLLNQHGNYMIVVSILAETSYPKAKQTQKRNNNDESCVLHTNDNKRQRTYDFMSASSFDPTAIYGYIPEARSKLYHEFPFLSSNGVNKILKSVAHNHYAIAHDFVCKGIMNGNVDSKDSDRQEEQYRLLKSSMTGVPLSQEQHVRLMVGTRRTTVVHPRRNKTSNNSSTPPTIAASNSATRSPGMTPLNITNDILLQEIAYVQQRQGEWMSEINERLLRKQNRAAAEQRGETIECPICYFDVAVDEMISCRDEGHLFCVDCVRRFAETQIFAQGSFGVDQKTKKPATDLLCMYSGGCSSTFPVEQLRKALPAKIMAKYDELQYRAAVSAAGIELFSCPKCGVQAEVPESQMIFQCPSIECGLETCKLCGEEAHIPLKCSEVEKKHETKGRLKVEEAISNAKIRTCPKPGCGNKFIKEDGCNKMTCPSCGTWSCYICRALIPKNVGYSHFCRTPHCTHQNCGMCPLHSNAEEDDKRAMREAGFAAAEKVRGESLIMASNTADGVVAKMPSEVRVDVDSLLKEAPGAAAHGRRR